ncbi:phage tail protein [Jiella marina]|uniref:phage tail protein n=1 Tax=Jiella sp. LLJ827 TaxID=2917712 RepID=UPI002100C691|nr:tail fiber protein [Jiella sp. LLJ827]MCQ0987694.1 tail fiber protein [Jiella sp. LLJ827]
MPKSIVSRLAALSAGVLSLLPLQVQPASAGLEPFVGELMLVPYNFCPRGWAAANGQLLAISSNSALFSLLGTNYGGDGRTTFGLPNLQGRAPISVGTGAALPTYVLGELGGRTSFSLQQQNMPVHTHTATATLSGTGDAATTPDPAGTVLATPSQNIYRGGRGATPNTPLAAGSVTVDISPSGGNMPVEFRSPYLAMQWCIALQGIFPSRS